MGNAGLVEVLVLPSAEESSDEELSVDVEGLTVGNAGLVEVLVLPSAKESSDEVLSVDVEGLAVGNAGLVEVLISASVFSGFASSGLCSSSPIENFTLFVSSIILERIAATSLLLMLSRGLQLCASSEP